MTTCTVCRHRREPVNCGGKSALTAEGSTAQQNAIALFNMDWAALCPGKQLAYNPTGFRRRT